MLYVLQALSLQIPVLHLLDCNYHSGGWCKGMPQAKDKYATIIILYFLIYQALYVHAHHTDQLDIILHGIYHHVSKDPDSKGFRLP